jgi:Ca-activated chloride channel homolog
VGSRRRSSVWEFVARAAARAVRVTAGVLAVNVIATSPNAQAQPADAAASMIVFDGSGSMWARLEGDKQAKFYLARDALKAGLTKANTSARFGLAAFGQRRQGDCSDVQIMMPPEDQAGGEKLATLIDKHNPRGKSPLAAALKEAAKALPKGSGPRSLIIVHDDLDNCNQDPCAALADIKTSAPNVVIHALGLGLKGDDAQRLQCLIKPTGGKLHDVQSASALNAAVEEVLKLASLATPLPTEPQAAAKAPAPAPKAAPTAAATAPAAPKSASVQRVALRKDGPSALRLATVLSTGVLPTARDVQWSVKSADTANTTPALTVRGQDVSLPLPPGPYVIEVQDGLTKPALIPVAVAPQGETGVDVPLNAGLLRATYPASAAFGRVMLFDAAEPTKAVAILPVEQLAAGVPLPPGKWIARLSEGLASRDLPLDIRAGATADLGATWPFARLAVTLAGEPAESRYPATIILFEDDPDAPRGRREIQRATVGGGDLVVPSGTYAVVVRQGAVEARDRVALLGGETTSRTITLAAARVKLSSRLAGATAPTAQAQPEPVAYRLERLDVVPPEIFTANRNLAELDIPAGRYRIEARHGLVNARASREVTLTGGQATAIALEQQAGTIRLAGPPGALGDLLWEILDETAHPLWSTAQASPIATLQAGRYIVRLDHRGKRLERRVEIRVGDTRTIELRE